MLSLPPVVRLHFVFAAGLLAGCAGSDLAAPTADAPSFARSVRVATLVVTTAPGDPSLEPGVRSLVGGVPTVVQVQALDKHGRPIARVEVTAESVDWASHWPGLAVPPLDPGAQTARTDATGTATFTLIYGPMWRVVTWGATAGSATVTVDLSVAMADVASACSAFWGQYTRDQLPECFQ